MKGLFLSALFCFGSANAQVYIEHTFPAALRPGEQRVIEVNMCKPAAQEFMQYELAFEPGIQVAEVASSGGNFIAAKNKAKVIWSLGAPAACVKFSVAVTAPVAGTFQLSQKIEYVFRGDKRSAAFEVISLVADPAAAEEAVTVRRSNPVVPAQLPMSRVDSLERSMQDPVQAARHVAELRKDAKDARIVGERESREAELEIAEARRALAQAEKSPDEKVRLTLQKEAEGRMQNATANLQVAQKILLLAQTLEKNADDIETAGRAAQVAAASQTVAPERSGDVEDLKKLFNKPGQGSDAAATAGADTLFHIQLGAFGQPPAVRDYKRAGKVNIINENGLYKVLVGGFRSRDEAVRRRQELAASGYDGFIVRYAGQRRVY